MALNLNIPALQEHPVFIAETRPQKIHDALENLKAESPADVALHIQGELEILNRQKISPHHRLQALESYRPQLMLTAQSLSNDYISSSLPLQDKAKASALAVESLWLELGYGYKLTLIDLQNQLFKLGTDKSSAQATQRAMHAVAEYALVHYQTYVIPPTHMWSDLHQLYFCAVQLGIQNVSIQDVDMAIGEANANTASYLATSIECTYKHAMLMSLAEPQHLTQQDIRLIADYLAHHIRLAVTTAVTPLNNTSGAFVISLNSDKPPAPYSKQKTDPNPITDILLQTIDLVCVIHQDLEQLQNHQQPKSGSIPTYADRNDYIELLTYLIKNWGITQKRIFNRSIKNGDIDVVVGVNTVRLVANEVLDDNNLTHKQALENSTSLQVAQATSSRWKILNISATGMSIRRHHSAEKNIRIGELIGIKLKNEHHWSVGVVRWANCGTRERLDIGVQLIAPQAQSATARLLQQNRDALVLMIPEFSAVKQAATIIAPKGTYEPARQLALTCNNETNIVMLTRLAERTHYIERIQYSII